MSGETVIQCWEGHIVSLDGDAFDARLIDVTGGAKGEEVEARVPWASVPGGRPDGLREGSYLRWKILRDASGATRPDFAFDIAGAWEAEEIAAAKARAAELSEWLAGCRGEGAGTPPPRGS